MEQRTKDVLAEKAFREIEERTRNDQGIPRGEPRGAYCLPEVLVWPRKQGTCPAIGLKISHMWSLPSLREQNKM